MAERDRASARLAECEARLSKAVEALRNSMHCYDCTCGECDYIRTVLAEIGGEA